MINIRKHTYNNHAVHPSNWNHDSKICTKKEITLENIDQCCPVRLREAREIVFHRFESVRLKEHGCGAKTSILVPAGECVEQGDGIQVFRQVH